MAVPFMDRTLYQILDLDLGHLGYLGTEDFPQSVQSCTLDWNLNRGTHWMGQLTLGGELDWDHQLIRPIRQVWNWATRQWDNHPRGAYMMARPSRALDVGEDYGEQVTEITSTVRLFSREYRLSRAPLGGALDVERGEVYTQALGNIIFTGGIAGAEITPDRRTLREPAHFDAGTDLLTVHNRLAKAINYWSLQAKPDGQLWTGPYLPPNKRLNPTSPDFNFTGMRMPQYGDPVDADWYQSEVVEETDEWETPNVIVGTSRTDGVQPYRAENYDNGRYSYVGRGGQWVAPREMLDGGGAINYDCPDQATLNAAVEEDLARRGSYAPRRFAVTAKWKPLTGPATGWLVHGDINTACQVTSWQEDMKSVQMKINLEELLF